MEVQMKKRIIALIILGVLCIIIPFIFNTYSIFRIISLLLGITFITFGCAIASKHSIFLSILIPVLLIVATYGIDLFLFYNFNHLPIYIYEIKSNSKVSTYNSLFYRIYNCQNQLTLDYGYKNSYTCGADDLDTININDFLEDPHKSYKEYHNKFVKITGKISSISGIEYLTLSKYTKESEYLNGYVSFKENYAIKVLTNENLSNYRIYDYITVIGKVTKIKDNIITLSDTILIPSTLYDNYTYEVKEKSSENLIEVRDYYFYGISSFNVIYDEENIYELSYLLTDSRFDWNTLINNSPSEIIKDEEDNEIAKKYILDKYNLLECMDGSKIIAGKAKKLNANTCNLVADQ